MSPHKRLRSRVAVVFLYFCLALGGVGTLSLLSACRKEPEAIVFGSDSCHHCKMTISDRRFGGEIVTKHGKKFKFDSLECLNGFQHSHGPEAVDGAEIFVLHGNGSGDLLNITDAKFQESPTLRAPMGRAFLAIRSKEKPLVSETAPALSWSEIKKQVEQKKSSP